MINSLLIGYDNDIEYFKSKYRPPSGQVYKHGSMIHHKKMLYNLLSATHPTILLKNLMAVLDSIKDREFYEDFVHGFLGNVSIDSNGVITFPDNTIRDALFNGKEKMAKDILDSFARVNNNINAVRFILGLQRAINTIDEGLEFRLNAERIITALAYAQYKGIDSIGLRELLLLRGAEFTLLTDIKYSETHDAMGRAAIIADKKNTSGNVRKYPDFSFEDGEYRFHVYSPREKSGMMLGYETNCCFRPDGHADINKRCKGYSLFDYCNTNPYGGIMDISQMIAGERVTLMGTPFLVNGNMGLFHSFETKMKDGDFSKVNELLIEGARRWIDKDSIDIVMITNFNITQRLDMEDKIILPPTFYPYLEGNASLYNGMYSNIADNSKRRHIVLAARVNGRIISGAELMKWYKEECGENPEVLKQKLNLHGGEIAQDYEFEDRPFRSSMIIGKDQNVPYEIESLSSSGNQTCFGFRNIIEHYYEKYVAFMKEHRDEIELFRAIHEHETNIQAARMKEEPIDSFEQFEIVNLRREIAELIAKRTGTSIPTSKLDAEVRKEEEIIYERLREITSLENPWEFAQVLGISDEVRARIEQRVDQELSSYKNDRAKKVLTSNQKRVQNHLIGMIRRQLAENPYNQALNDLLTQVRNGDLSIISSEETGLTLQLRKPIQNYLGVFCARDDDREFIQNERECSNKTERERRIIAYSGNVDMVETVMAEIMFSDTEMNHREQGVKRVSAKEKFRLFKYAITKGIKDREQMDSIMHSIDRSKPILEHTDELHFGRNWYIAMSRRIHDVSIAFNPNLTEAERDDAIKQMSEVLVEKQKRFTQKHPGRVWRKTNNDSLEEV